MSRKRAPTIRRLSPELARQQAIADFVQVCATPAGRRVLWQVVTESGVWSPIRAPSPDIHYNEGRRSVGLWLMGLIDEADATLIPLMMQEARNAEFLAEQSKPMSPTEDEG